jgi:Cys-rich four helix bundle protein (predicted Tat secretion target)
MTMSRRDLLASGTALGAAYGLGVGAAFAADEHAGHAHSAPAGPAAGGLARAAAECVRAGEECVQHCLDLLARGDTSLGECAKSVNQMLAVCRAAGPLAYADSKHLKTFAKLCADVCSECETACRKHESHHAVCKSCAEACARTVAEAKKV